MPIYEYRCDACGHEFEKLQKISADPLVDCPACEKPELKKLVSAAGFRLKGSGWYETDFKGGNKKNLHAADAKSAADKGEGGKKESSSASNESKPATAGNSGKSNASAD